VEETREGPGLEELVGYPDREVLSDDRVSCAGISQSVVEG
jgi:hypothetical protein